MSLLKKALKSKARRQVVRKDRRAIVPPDFTHRELAELAIAWVSDVVTLAQVSGAMGYGRKTNGNLYAHMAIGLRTAYRIGLIKVKN